MIKVGIVGSSGYTAGELLRCLVHHPEVTIDFLYSHSNTGEAAFAFHGDLLPFPDLKFSQDINSEVEVLFLCLGHGHSKSFLSQHHFSEKTKIIDLSTDFRHINNAIFQGKDFVYGLVEYQKDKIKNAHYVANPGCFATAIQLALLPLAANNLLERSIHVNAITGSTGAGQKPTATTHFSWRNNNVSVYKAFRHQHLTEIKETLNGLQPDFGCEINFLPVRGNFARGILASVYMESDLSTQALEKIYHQFYEASPFVFISKSTIHLKQVVNTNNCFLEVHQIDGKVLITSIIDNLLKGAAGQAIQNMNLMMDLPETTGLNLKANYF